jgi:hypothetical protein
VLESLSSWVGLEQTEMERRYKLMNSDEAVLMCELSEETFAAFPMSSGQ